VSLFGALVRTAVNVVALPVAAAKDVVTLGGVVTEERSALVEAVERLKREAEDEPEVQP
jgi:hypothetical protein